MSIDDNEITIERIIEKLGFDPREGVPRREIHAFEDDSIPSVWAPLSYEESKWLTDNKLINFHKNA